MHAGVPAQQTAHICCTQIVHMPALQHHTQLMRNVKTMLCSQKRTYSHPSFFCVGGLVTLPLLAYTAMRRSTDGAGNKSSVISKHSLPETRSYVTHRSTKTLLYSMPLALSAIQVRCA
jgi:hypothetical protein